MSGKTYNGEKAIISMTSWKARIYTVGLTIFNLIRTCPGFHIVLVLSEEEFPNKEAELPKELLILLKKNLFELLWVKKNYKSFKKILFTMDKYPSVPIISADDDCIYKYNYANELYEHWLSSSNSCVTYYRCDYKGFTITGGYATLYPPNIFKGASQLLNDEIISNHEDDCLYAVLRNMLNRNYVKCLNKSFADVALTHDENDPLHNKYRGSDMWKRHLMNISQVICTGKIQAGLTE